MRTVIVTDSGGDSGGLDPLWFHGGHTVEDQQLNTTVG